MFSALRHIVRSVLIISLFISISYSPGYGSTSIPMEKEVVIGFPIASINDLPNEVIFKIYDSEKAAMPIAYQGFYRGEYSAYYNIAMSDGFTQKSVVRFKVEFTNLSQSGIYVDTSKGTENLWIEVELDRKLTGGREPLDRETTNQILLAIAAGDTGKSDTSKVQDINQGSYPQNAGNYQSTSRSQTSVYASNITVHNVAGSNGQVQFNNGGVQAGASQFYYNETLKTVGIGTSSPVFPFEIKAGTTQAFFQPVYDTEVRFGSNAHPLVLYSGGTERVRIDANVIINPVGGNVGIGTSSPCPDCKLAVNGKIRAKQVVVDTGWSDFVFKDDYTLMPLQELEKFIEENRHLPDIPTEADVKDNGISVGDISAKLLQKIEELTLYIIELKKENEAVRSELSVLQKQMPYSWSLE